LQKNPNAALLFRIVRGQMHEHANSSHAFALLRPRRRAAEKRNKIPPPHTDHGDYSPAQY